MLVVVVAITNKTYYFSIHKSLFCTQTLTNLITRRIIDLARFRVQSRELTLKRYLVHLPLGAFSPPKSIRKVRWSTL